MEYKSRYPELGFYVNGEVRYFRDGRYVTEDPATIAVLDSISDAECAAAEDEPTVTPEVKPARKTSANASAK